MIKNELQKRILSSLFIIPIAIFFIFQETLFFVFFLSIFFLISSYEWIKMNKKNFIGKKSLEKEIARGPDWKFIGIEIEWDQLEKLYREVGLAPGLPSTAWRSSTPLYYNDQQVGYATSGAWSPILKRYIALAHVKSNFAMVGTALDFEIKIEHFRRLTKAKIVKTPFFDPARKRSCPK